METFSWSSGHGYVAEVFAALQRKAKSLAAAIRSPSTRRAVVVFLVLLSLVAFISASWNNGAALNTALGSWIQPAPLAESPKPQPLTLNCPSTSTANQTQLLLPFCERSSNPSSSSYKHDRPSPSCPQYFRWIYEDLRPWSSTGISRQMVEGARPFATFRLVVLDGRKVYVEKYRGVFQTRDVFTIWGILQLVRLYPGRLPDLDLMFDCDDFPVVRTADYPVSPPPPVFHYCKDNNTSDILFPDWSFWGWPETNIKPWNTLMEELKEGNEMVKWSDRIPYAYWKGNPWMGGNRQDLMKCNASNNGGGPDWGARLYAQDWNGEIIKGFKNSNLASQCQHRYKIFVEGIAWSVSQKYILACDSPALVVTPHFYEFFSRALMSGYHYWPIQESNKCSSIKFAVDWGNNHQEEAQAMGKAGSGFVQEELKMEYVYDYMLHLLTEYAKLLSYKPSVPENASQVCLESMACEAKDGVKEFLLESMVRWTRVEEPCTIPPPFSPAELHQLLQNKSTFSKQVEMWEGKAA